MRNDERSVDIATVAYGHHSDEGLSIPAELSPMSSSAESGGALLGVFVATIEILSMLLMTFVLLDAIARLRTSTLPIGAVALPLYLAARAIRRIFDVPDRIDNDAWYGSHRSDH